MALVELVDVGHVFFAEQGYTTALQNVNCEIEEGELVAFIGPSGCGKSTALSIIAQLLTPTTGVCHFAGQQHDIGYMLQQDFLFPWKSIADNIALGLKLQQKPSEVAVTNYLQEFELSHTLRMFPSQLSGGMRQRVALARTMVMEPKLMLLDEPFSALDYQTKLELENFVVSTLKRHAKTAILVTHDISEAIAMCDRIYLFSKSPGTIAREFIVPEEIRVAQPFEARSLPTFQPFFQQVWKELEAYG